MATKEDVGEKRLDAYPTLFLGVVNLCVSRDYAPIFLTTKSTDARVLKVTQLQPLFFRFAEFHFDGFNLIVQTNRRSGIRFFQ